MKWSLVWIPALLALGCTPDTGGGGGGDDASSGDTSDGDTTGGGPGPSSATDDSTGGGTTVGEGSTEGPSETTDAETSATDSAEGSSTGEPGCPPETQVHWAADGTVEPPMELVDSPLLMMEVGRSWALGAGSLTWELQTECEGPVYLWILAWDNISGMEPENPDSYFVTVGEEPEVVVEYGCATEGLPDQSWRWVPVESSTGKGCAHDPLEISLPAGTHSVIIRNREPGVGVDAARIAGFVLSHDPGADPTEFIDPQALP